MTDAALKAQIDDLVKKLVEAFNLSIPVSAVRDMVKTYYDQGIEDMEIKFDMNFKRDPERLQAMETYVIDNLKDLNEEIRSKIRKEITQGLLNLESVEDLKRRIKDITDISVERAKTIARTESARALSIARMDAARNSGLELRKQWITGRDPCPYCRELDGKKIRMDQKFKTSNGLAVDTPPLHPNCTCDVLYIQKVRE